LSPWLVGFWVEASRRNRSIGAQLLAAACAHARGDGIACIYAATTDSSNLFTREGWSAIDTAASDLGVKTTVFRKAVAP
jgi:N-acetylglutamate synthase-like GNAT family acetyltransferase